MRVPLSWLRGLCGHRGMSPAELAELLTRTGLEAEGMEFLMDLGGLRAAVGPGQGAGVQHPGGEAAPQTPTLVLADVDYGAAEPHTVVTGAPNLYQYKGLGRLGHRLKSVSHARAPSCTTATPRGGSRWC